jgi:hypothetical protein
MQCGAMCFDEMRCHAVQCDVMRCDVMPQARAQHQRSLGGGLSGEQLVLGLDVLGPAAGAGGLAC